MSQPQLKDKPIQVATFRFELKPQTGACRDLVIKHRHTGKTLEVERAEIAELIQGLQNAYYEK